MAVVREQIMHTVDASLATSRLPPVLALGVVALVSSSKLDDPGPWTMCVK